MTEHEYGARARELEREKRKESLLRRIGRQTDELIEADLPELTKSVPSLKEYCEQRDVLCVKLKEVFLDISLYKAALRHLIRRIDAVNRASGCNLPLPPRPISSLRIPQSRTRDFFKMGSCCSEIYQYWRAAFSLAPETPPSLNAQLADAGLSALFYGGLACPQALLAFVNHLRMEKQPLNQFCELQWLDLVWDAPDFSHNIMVADEGKTLRRFYPDYHTRLFIWRYLQARQVIDCEPITATELWQLILGRLREVMLDAQESIPKSLAALLLGAPSVTEMLDNVSMPQILLEYSRGEIEAMSLPEHFHGGWLQPDLSPEAEYKKISMAELQDVFGALTHKHSHHKKHTSQYIGKVLRDIDHTLRQNKLGIKRSAKEASAELMLLRSDDHPVALAILLDWLINDLQRLALSSVKRYFCEVKAVWFSNPAVFEIHKLDSDNLEVLYEGMLEQRTDNEARNYLAGRLKELHVLGVTKFNLAKVQGVFRNNRANSFVRAAIIPEAIFQRMLQRTQSVYDAADHFKEGLAVLLLLAYRLGLRRGELIKLRVKDVEESAQNWLFIRDNKYGNNKSHSATRKIPPLEFLLPNEKIIFNNYLVRRRSITSGYAQALLFSFDNSPTTPLDPALLSKLVTIFCTDYGLQGASFHTLRHSAANHLAIVLDGNADLIKELTPYTPDEANKLRLILTGGNSHQSRDNYWSLSGLIGHLTPHTTFQSYLHCADRLLHQRLIQHQPALSRQETMLMSGCTSNKVSYWCRHYADNTQTVPLSSWANYVLGYMQEWTDNKTGTSEYLPVQSRKEIFPAVKVNVSPQNCYQILRALSRGEDIAELAVSNNIKEQKIDTWRQRAMQLQEMVTRRGISRLSKSKTGYELLPFLPREKYVQQDVNELFDMLRKNFTKQQNEIIWTVQHFLTVTSANRNGIRFSTVADLQRFLGIFGQCFSKRWILELNVPECLMNSQDTKRWQRDIPIEVRVRSGKSSGVITALLFLQHRDESRLLEAFSGRKYSHYSSPALRFVFHMLAIMLNFPIVDMPLRKTH